MANRAVLGGVAAIAGLYAWNEHLKERQIEHEKKELEERQRHRDEQNAKVQRERENVRRRANNNNGGGGHGMSAHQLTSKQALFLLYKRIDLLMKVVQDEVMRTNHHHHRLDLRLPLLSSMILTPRRRTKHKSGENRPFRNSKNNSNTADEIILGAALSFGNPVVLESIMPLIMSVPGLAMAHLTSTSLDLLLRTYGSLLYSIPISSQVPDVTLLDALSHFPDIVNRMIQFALITGDELQSRPLVQKLSIHKAANHSSNNNVHPFRHQRDVHYHKVVRTLLALQLLANDLGLRMLPGNAVTATFNEQESRMEFEVSRHMSLHTNWIASSIRRSRGPGNDDDDEASHYCYLGNFEGDFACPGQVVRRSTNDGRHYLELQYHLSNVVLLSPERKSKAKRRFQRRHHAAGATNSSHQSLNQDRILEPNLNKAADLLADVMFARTVGEAIKRLKQVKGDVEDNNNDDPISLEHIAVRAGYDGPLFSILRESDDVLMATGGSRIEGILSKKFIHLIPSPEWKPPKRVGTNDAEEEEQPSSATSPTPALKAEVSKFLQSYMELLRWSTCVIPKLHGKPPSQWVPTTEVDQVGRDPFFDSSAYRGIRSIQRTLELEERDRIVKARTTMSSAPSVENVLIILMGLVVFLYWLSYKAIQTSIQPRLGLSMPMVCLLTSIFTPFTMQSLTEYLRGPLQVPRSTASSSSSFQGHMIMSWWWFHDVWSVTSSLVEWMIRRYREWKGLPNPFESRLEMLQKACIVRKKYYEALLGRKKKKKIGYMKCLYLLESLADDPSSSTTGLMSDGDIRFFTQDEAILCSGTLPGGRDEAESFLNLEVVNDTNQEEEEEDDDDDLMQLRDIFYDVSEFQTGDRVSVELPDTVEAIRSMDGNFGDDDDDDDDETKEMNNRLLMDFASPSACTYVGSVITSPTLDKMLIIYLDGMKAPMTVLSTWCTKLEERPLLRDAVVDETGEADDRNEEKNDEKKVVVEDVVSEDEATTNTEEEEKSEPILFRKARTVEEALVEGGWEFIRHTTHIVYKRKVKKRRTTVAWGPSDQDNRAYEVQTFTRSSTPGTYSGRGALSTLNRLNREGEPFVPEGQDTQQSSSSSAGQRNQDNTSKAKNIRDEKGQVLCGSCQTYQSESNFSRSQLKKISKGKNASSGIGRSVKCKTCIVASSS